MNYALIKNFDIADGEGVRVSLFVSGCRNHCKGCFQPETWDFSYGKEFTRDTVEEIKNCLKPHYIDGLTLLGGDPFEIENQEALLPFVLEIRKEFPMKNIWAYSGYTFEELTGSDLPVCGKCTDLLLHSIDVLVDGRFIEEKKNISLSFRGSENQRIIDLKKTFLEGRLCLLE